MKSLAKIIALVAFMMCWETQAQNIGNLKGQKPVRLSGSINANMNFYESNRDIRSRDPFFWTLSGSPTLSIYGLTLPFNFVVSQKQQDFRQPFNQFGVSPYYKWLTVHLGYRNLSFSQYTLNGHIFNGVGAEANPGNWRLGAMYGRLLRPIEEDTLNFNQVQPTYLRRGYSVKVGYGKSTNYVDLIVFKGWDIANSIERPVDSAAVNPQENVALGIKARQRILQKVTLSVDFAISGWTSNLFANGPPREDIPLAGLIDNLLEVNYSTQFLRAGKASLAFKLGQLSLKTQYERIDPDFQTMGAYFFNNDLENITVSPSWSMFNRKLRIAGRVGWQRNNLFDDKNNQTNRLINALRVNYSASSRFSVSTSLTNFQINRRRIDLVQRDAIDSLELEQFSNSITANANYSFGTKVRKYTINLSAYHQSFGQNQANETFRDNDSRSITPSLTLRFRNKDTKLSWRVGANYNDFQGSGISSSRIGVRASASKKLMSDKLSLGLSGAYFSTQLDDQKGGNTLRFGSRISLTPIEKHTLGFNANLIRRISSNTRVSDFTEFLGSINYSYAF
ncbi:MAG: hypothetical protein AAFX87_21885 [Bacteroidota bacterium]